MKKIYYFIIPLVLAVVFTKCTKEEEKIIETEIELGEELFFDKILSIDKTISCASCHSPEFGFADNKKLSVGVGGKLGTRNAPSVMNMDSRSEFFWDGRSPSLEAQAIGPVENPVEMNMHFTEAVERINANKRYVELFQKIYKEKPNTFNITNAIAEFQRSLESDGSAPHDKWINGEDENAMSESQLRGRILFIGKANCFDCHFGPDFTGDEFRNIGLFDGKELVDSGRYDFTKKPEDIGKFKVPGLRNTALTAPYMHNGMFETLEEVMDYYSNPYDFVEKPIGMDTIMTEPLNLTDQEKTDLVNFMHSLTDENIPYLDRK